MKISNNYISLDQEFKRLTEKIKEFSQTNESMKKELDILHQSGFKDEKFENLRQVVNDSMADLKKIEEALTKKTSELKAYSDIIKQYYAISI